MSNITLSVAIENFPIAGTFTIARGAKTVADVVVATLTDGLHVGRGECVPYGRYGETVDGVAAAIASLAPAFASGIDRRGLAALLPAGAARNALDCALWDLEAKRSGTPVHILAGVPAAIDVTTCYTLSLGTPDTMAAAAERARDRPLLKVKLGGDGDADRIRAVRRAAPDATLVVDANEAWTPANWADNIAACLAADVRLIEQPFPADHDAALADLAHPIPICADESLHTSEDLERLAALYDAINIKLDKTGGLTEALNLMASAKRLGLQTMVGCMVGTSLGMAPAMLLAGRADFVDLDGPLLLAHDRQPGLTYQGSRVSPSTAALWG